MKKTLIFLFLIASITTNAQKDGLKWLTNLDSAKKKAESVNKPILMYFTGSDWCSPCKMLHEDFFATTKFKEQSKNVILLKVDIPRRIDIISEKQLKHNKKLMAQYNKQGGFPNVVAIDHTGKIIGVEGSYSASLRDPNRYFNFVKDLVGNYQ